MKSPIDIREYKIEENWSYIKARADDGDGSKIYFHNRVDGHPMVVRQQGGNQEVAGFLKAEVAAQKRLINAEAKATKAGEVLVCSTVEGIAHAAKRRRKAPPAGQPAASGLVATAYTSPIPTRQPPSPNGGVAAALAGLGAAVTAASDLTTTAAASSTTAADRNAPPPAEAAAPASAVGAGEEDEEDEDRMTTNYAGVGGAGATGGGAVVAGAGD